ncbi:MAG: hypothetical protein H6Q89_5594 [Myxococcaceae bacterium]|nr:hypothetical protein [Myxococcaceae bacterium]
MRRRRRGGPVPGRLALRLRGVLPPAGRHLSAVAVRGRRALRGRVELRPGRLARRRRLSRSGRGRRSRLLRRSPLHRRLALRPRGALLRPDDRRGSFVPRRRRRLRRPLALRPGRPLPGPGCWRSVPLPHRCGARRSLVRAGLALRSRRPLPRPAAGRAAARSAAAGRRGREDSPARRRDRALRRLAVLRVRPGRWPADAGLHPGRPAARPVSRPAGGLPQPELRARRLGRWAHPRHPRQPGRESGGNRHAVRERREHPAVRRARGRRGRRDHAAGRWRRGARPDGHRRSRHPADARLRARRVVVPRPFVHRRARLLPTARFGKTATPSPSTSESPTTG